MKRFRLSLLGCLIAVALATTIGFALAQAGSPETPANTPLEPSKLQEPPPGGCMPIGVTVSGEIVFPFQCKDFIEQKKGVSSGSNPAPLMEEQAQPAEKRSTAEQRPGFTTPANSTGQKDTLQNPEKVQSEEIATSTIGDLAVAPKKADGPEKADRRRRAREQSNRHTSSGNCTHYRTYNANTGTYRDYLGRRRTCQS